MQNVLYITYILYPQIPNLIENRGKLQSHPKVCCHITAFLIVGSCLTNTEHPQILPIP